LGLSRVGLSLDVDLAEAGGRPAATMAMTPGTRPSRPAGLARVEILLTVSPL